jgi:hypothetical protein
MKVINRASQKETRNDNASEPNSIRSKVFNFIEPKKVELANFLSQQSERLSQRNKKIALLIFGIVLGGASLFLIVDSVRTDSAATWALSEQGSIPKSIVQQQNQPLISKDEYELLVAYRNTLDSLKLQDPFTYHRLLENRQGLIDSLNFLISLYH